MIIACKKRIVQQNGFQSITFWDIEGLAYRLTPIDWTNEKNFGKDPNSGRVGRLDTEKMYNLLMYTMEDPTLILRSVILSRLLPQTKGHLEQDFTFT